MSGKQKIHKPASRPAPITTARFGAKSDVGQDISEHLDLSSAPAPGQFREL
jgi:hypothetical protein